MGNFEIRLPLDTLQHNDFYKIKVRWPEGSGERIPSYARYVTQDDGNKLFCSRVWQPEQPYEFKHSSPSIKNPPLIYEAHIGMAQEDGKVSSYNEFRENVLPRVIKSGYNTIQIMAVQEHPFYGSFGYQVSSFFAPSSRFGTPDELKQLIDEAHAAGLAVIMDIVHSHAVKNETEGLARFDGTSYQYFHEGNKGYHSAWDTMCFDYGKKEVLHFLLSNCKYWLEEFNFDGFRFDGVTSMIYHHHGLSRIFMSYDDYFNDDLDQEAVTYLSLANKLIHQVKPSAITIAEDVSGMPGMAASTLDGGIGFDYRLGMGLPDYWIKLTQDVRDEDWHMESIWHELTNRRVEERVISYVESHDQALVGDKTIMFRLIGKDMYTNMHVDHRNLIVDRGLSLHKLIRFITLCTANGGYLNFMGNEFGHPEWVDFPRDGNGWSYHYARRQWSLVDSEELCYKYMSQFDYDMLQFIQKYRLLQASDPLLSYVHVDDHVIAFERGELLFVLNFDPVRSFVDYQINARHTEYNQIFNTDLGDYGGFDRVPDGQTHTNIAKKEEIMSHGKVSLYLPMRSAIVLEPVIA